MLSSNKHIEYFIGDIRARCWQDWEHGGDWIVEGYVGKDQKFSAYWMTQSEAEKMADEWVYRTNSDMVMISTMKAHNAN